MQTNVLTGTLIFGLLLAAFSTEASADGNIKWGPKFFPLNKHESAKVPATKNAGAITQRSGGFFALSTTKINSRINPPRPRQEASLPRVPASINRPLITASKPAKLIHNPERLTTEPPKQEVEKNHLELASLPEPSEKPRENQAQEVDIDEELPAEIAGSDEYQKAIKSILPTLAHAWPFGKGDAERITSAFGWRKHPVTHSRAFHQGIDIAAAVGTEVLASADGVVAKTGEHKNLGRFVKILHGDGSYSVYGHLKNWAVKTGELVKQGAKIAEVGMTGRTTGPHLHYSIVVDGKAANPMKFLKKNLPDSQLALVM